MPNRYVAPHLFDAQVVALSNTPLAPALIDELSQMLETELPPNAIPVAIRWRLKPERGIPNAPFQVWRRYRERLPNMLPLPIGSVTVNGETTVRLGSSFFAVELIAQPNAGQALTIQMLDHEEESVDGERITVTTGAAIRLRAANICNVQVAGSGTVHSFMGLTMEDFVNDPDWEHIETVGLPVEESEVPPDVYDTQQFQGLPGSLRPGNEAALLRLKVGELLAQAPPTTTPGGITPPNWPTPVPDAVLNQEIRGGNPSPMSMVLEMLDVLNPTLPGNSQAFYRRPMDITGMQQPGGGVTTDPAQVSLPVAGMVLLNAATDTWSALGFGFGTTDFPPYIAADDDYQEPPAAYMPPYDYMITYEAIYPWGIVRELAAPASLSRLDPVTPNKFKTSLWLQNRPMTRDTAGDHDVALTWERPRQYAPPGGYALAILEGGDPARWLNTARPAGGFKPHVPAINNKKDEFIASYIDPARVTPISGSRTDTYINIAHDVFGRWSEWEEKDFTVVPDPPARPQILAATFQMDPGNANGRNVPATLEVEVAWDWEDRSPDKIELVGSFFVGSNLPNPVPTGVQTQSGGGLNDAIILSFTSNNIDLKPTVTQGNATVDLIPAVAEDGDTRRYRVILNGFSLNFNNINRLNYAVFARGSEQVNIGLFGNYSEPLSTTAIDPLPADVPVMLPDIRWTALPDANGDARYRLEFNSIPHAAGYVIYEATEAAIREAVGLGPITDPDLIPRGLDMEDHAADLAALDTYARVNRELLEQPSIDLTVPGASSGLTVYRISSVTASQVESVLSGPILVAVPQRLTPGTPSLSIKVVAGVVHIRVVQGNGDAPAGIELYRTKSAMLATNANEMGPPVADVNAPWQISTDAEGRKVFELQDTVSPGWMPYYYRAVAIGPHDDVAGIYPGRSGASSTVEAVVLPTTPPDVRYLSTATLSDSLVRVTIQSLAEVRTAPAGRHRITVLTINRQSTYPQVTEHVQAELPFIPEHVGSPVPVIGEVTRSQPGADGWRLYATGVPLVDDQIVVQLTDPLGRTSELAIAMPDPPTPPPPPPPGPNLTNLTVSQVLQASYLEVTVTCDTDVPITPPIIGGYELTAVVDTVTDVIKTTAMIHNIPYSADIGEWARSKGPVNGLYEYRYRVVYHLPTMTRLASVTVSLSDPDGNTTELRNENP